MVVDPPHFEATHVLSVITPFILLHAFANGTTALTGVEAISNGITAFKEPRSKNAGYHIDLDVSDPGFIISCAFISHRQGASCIF
jgi:hypothetical protein